MKNQMKLVLLLLLPISLLSSSIQFEPIGESNSTIHVQGPITSDFSQWLEDNGYADDDFARLDYGDQGSYGGKSTTDETVGHQPVVFIHGNSDAALAAGSFAGWTNTIHYFEDHGWTSASLYATSWGDDDAWHASLRTHDCNTTQRLRRFLLAVQDYTKSDKISVISHSMGVTLGRKAILGGKIEGSDSECNLGVPLRFVDVFVGLSGANYGLCNCLLTSKQPTCNHDNGFWPGNVCGFNSMDQCGTPKDTVPCTVQAYSKFLTDLNSDFTQLAKRVVSAWSTEDDAIQYDDNVWGRPTSLIPRTNTKKIYANYTHMEIKESPESVQDQFDWVNRII